ncbi:unnamed protein product [Dovyalis caffra]|uniref:Uncharacterized protein n=1 Tax=Dovyalis caffra TaxID=77055 RepID=A0AAV1SHW7_9ROSI|nr:unnamed protein product [Dovyalis caffra]
MVATFLYGKEKGLIDYYILEVYNNMNMGTKDFNELYGSSCSMGLSLSRNIEYPSASIGFGGIRKVKVNQAVKNSSKEERCMGFQSSSLLLFSPRIASRIGRTSQRKP